MPRPSRPDPAEARTPSVRARAIVALCALFAFAPPAAFADAPAGGDGLFLVALEPDGAERWRRQDGTPADEGLYAASPAPGAGVYLAISSSGDLDDANAGG